MDQARETFKKLVASIRKIAEMDPQDEAVSKTVDELNQHAQMLNEQVSNLNDGIGKESAKEDLDRLKGQVDKLHSAAIVPASNYRRIAVITNKLRGLVKVASLPQNAKVRPQIEQVVKKCAGIFAEIDTVADLDKPLEQIEKAVDKLYGDQSKNDMSFFERRGKGNHGKGE